MVVHDRLMLMTGPLVTGFTVPQNQNFQIHPARLRHKSLDAAAAWRIAQQQATGCYIYLHCSATSDWFDTIFTRLGYKVYHPCSTFGQKSLITWSVMAKYWSMSLGCFDP